MFHAYSILIILVITMGLFVWGRWRYDIVALIALAISAAVGAVPFHKLYSGLDNSAVITIACVMIISQTIGRSGILNHLVNRIGHLTKSPTLHVASLGLITLVMSGFMNNLGALALIMPVAIKTAIEQKRSPTFILMPLEFASALGGLTTLIGTPDEPNVMLPAPVVETVRSRPTSASTMVMLPAPVLLKLTLPVLIVPEAPRVFSVPSVKLPPAVIVISPPSLRITSLVSAKVMLPLVAVKVRSRLPSANKLSDRLATVMF